MMYDFNIGLQYKEVELSTGDIAIVRGVTIGDIMRDKTLYTLPFQFQSYLKVKYDNKMYGQMSDEYMEACVDFSNIGEFEVEIEDYDLVMQTIAELSIPTFKIDEELNSNIKGKVKKAQQNIHKKSGKERYLSNIGITEDLHLLIKAFYQLVSLGIDRELLLNTTYRVIYNLHLIFDEIKRKDRADNMQDELSVEAMFQLQKDGAKIFYDRIEELGK